VAAVTRAGQLAVAHLAGRSDARDDQYPLNCMSTKSVL
jgi:hypothetical protein